MARIKIEGTSAVYHCISRVVGGQMLLDDLDKKKLVQILGKMAEYCGVEIITYCMMSNHFHLLVRVPVPVELSDEELLERMTQFYGKKGVLTVLVRESLQKRGKIDQDLRDSAISRRGDVSAFMKEFKQRFTRVVNEMFIRHRDRFGPRRKDGARPIRGVPLPGMNVLRDLRVNAVG